MSLMLSMAAFALAASISPGPVNIVALSAGARHGFRASLRHVSGATLGFVLLLVLIGLGLHELLRHWPAMTQVLHWAGVVFLLYMAWKLASDNGELGAGGATSAPSVLAGATLQWLNPKAWLACVAGIGAYVGEGDSRRLWQFSAIYLVICFLSIASWAWAGSAISHSLSNAQRMRRFNRCLALLLLASALYLLVG
ncbi:LysE family translocator [Pseudomonas sp. SORT22]|uniref:LysE family translocator n=1 Tax=unclassified Pseudomonas TaxID=196821 RepID=UPI000884F469|nr:MULTISPECIES: LysE family translocator [unclassified Pseudomonas]QVM98970.1 LysE family translocator [Pseudomonas sp. SORT22]SDQ65024.1 Threonine/homoserine/homoserine lactone efflux protein [Pseudomonas sp. UC 17F4]